MTEIEYDPLDALPSIGPSAQKNLQACGYESVQDVRDASKADLMEVPYIGENKAEFLCIYLDQ